ncbi:MAG: hypothetical protein KGJ62_01785 [Armatimonadetes bacterium]|nr:hypothetical protein [Armatimonadota bacterium]MDE2205509.1 hypothetical protein [Armatimonadota bacterium]
MRGRVVAVLREQHTPQNSNGANEAAIYLVAVERWLRGGTSSTPRVLKVLVPGADLPWAESNARGVGFRFDNDPMLKPGARYIMFLQLIASRGGLHQAGPVMAEADGVTGVGAENDEFMFPEGLRGKVLLQRGMALSLPTSDTHQPWKFDDGEQIVGIPASVSEAEIAQAVAEVASTTEGHQAGRH